jgi:hypothetical protein
MTHRTGALNIENRLTGNAKQETVDACQPYRSRLPPAQTVMRFPRVRRSRLEAADHCPILTWLNLS